jgi:hypothetical protein
MELTNENSYPAYSEPILTPFEDPYRLSADVLCYELHGVVLRLLGKIT